MGNRDDMLNCARAWIGRNEQDDSHREIIDVYNSFSPHPRGYRMLYYDPWCAAFVSACAIRCGLTDIIPPECGCDPMIRQFQALGCWVEDDAYTPSPGDIIFYDWQAPASGDCVGSADHVGIVEEITADGNGPVIVVIEGNMGDAVRRRYIRVNSSDIRGYAVPRYDDSDNVSEETECDSSDLGSKIFPVARYGDISVAVRAMQNLLHNVWGCRLPTYGCDGEWGDETETALRQFCTVKQLYFDGEVTEEIWLALIGG